VFYIQEFGTYVSDSTKFLDRIYLAFDFLQITPLLGQSLKIKIDVPTDSHVPDSKDGDKQ